MIFGNRNEEEESSSVLKAVRTTTVDPLYRSDLCRAHTRQAVEERYYSKPYEYDVACSRYGSRQ